MNAKEIREEIRNAQKPLLDIIALLNKNNYELTERVKALESQAGIAHTITTLPMSGQKQRQGSN